MDSVLYGYSVSGATWLYLSALLIIGVYFRFNRLWSRRNLDLLLLLSLSPGLLLIGQPSDSESATRAIAVGYGLLLTTTGLLLLRVLFDPFSRWRPRFEQNMNSAGMLWLIICSLIFLGTRAVVDKIPSETQQTVERGDQLLTLQAGHASDADTSPSPTGPAGPLVAAPLLLLSKQLTPSIFAISSHLAIVGGLLFIGRKLFDDFASGVAMSALYLLLPCTAFSVGDVANILPASFLVWAVAMWRRPAVAGVLVAFACGTLVFPVFLLPLWVSFYGKLAWKRFAAGFAACAIVLFGSYALTSSDVQEFVEQTTGAMQWYRVGLEAPVVQAAEPTRAVSAGSANSDFWQASHYWGPYRLPVIAAFAVLVIVMTIWPRPKSLELLLAQTVAVVIAAQFWLPDRAGALVLWYLPLLLTLMFRPRLTGTFAESEPLAASAKQPSRTERSTAVPVSTMLR